MLTSGLQHLHIHIPPKSSSLPKVFLRDTAPGHPSSGINCVGLHPSFQADCKHFRHFANNRCRDSLHWVGHSARHYIITLLPDWLKLINSHHTQNYWLASRIHTLVVQAVWTLTTLVSLFTAVPSVQSHCDIDINRVVSVIAVVICISVVISVITKFRFLHLS